MRCKCDGVYLAKYNAPVSARKASVKPRYRGNICGENLGSLGNVDRKVNMLGNDDKMNKISISLVSAMIWVKYIKNVG